MKRQGIRLKIWPEYFEKKITGVKSWELRFDDYGFMEGESILFQEWDPETERYTGRELLANITFVYKIPSMFGLENWVILSDDSHTKTLNIYSKSK